MNKQDLADDIKTGMNAMLHIKTAGGLKEVNEYDLGITMILTTVAIRLEMGEDEANIAVQRCKYALGLSANDIPLYMRSEQHTEKR